MGTGTENERNLLFILFFLSFCFFSSVFQTFSFFFSFPFPALEGKWEWEGVGIFPLLFLFYSFLWKRGRGATGKIWRKFFLFFSLIFCLFSFWKPFSFSVFGRRNWKIGRIKMSAPNTLKEICKNIICFSKTKLLSFRQKHLSFSLK